MYSKILQLLRDRLLVFEYFSHLPDLIRTPPFRDRPFLTPGDGAECNAQGYEKFSEDFVGVRKIFTTFCRGTKNFRRFLIKNLNQIYFFKKVILTPYSILLLLHIACGPYFAKYCFCCILNEDQIIEKPHTAVCTQNMVPTL